MFLFSCSLLQKRPERYHFDHPVSLKEGLKNICLNAEGEGEIFLGGQTNRFSFESVEDVKNQIWKMGFFISLYGEQLVYMNYKDALKESVVLGSFYRQLVAEVVKSGPPIELKKQLLQNFFLGLGIFIKLRRLSLDAKLEFFQKKLSETKLIFEGSYDSARYSFQPSKKTSLEIYANERTSSYFKKIKVSLKLEDQKEFIWLTLRLESCAPQ